MFKKYFLVVFFTFVFLFSALFVSAQSCSAIGQITSDKYCDVDSQLKNLKLDGASCLNDYECEKNSCIDGVCQDKYSFSGLSEQKSLIENLWNLIQGYECSPEETSCDGKDYLVCGLEFTWENKGNVDGKCGFVSSGSSTKSSSRSCAPNWVCGNWSNYVAQYNTECGSRICTDTRNCGNTNNKPGTFFSCPIVDLNYCGDKTCSGSETQNSCPQDCGQVISLSVCGDGVCASVGESSNSCPQDCKPEPRKNNIGLFLFLVVLIISAIAYVSYLIYRRVKRKNLLT